MRPPIKNFSHSKIISTGYNASARLAQSVEHGTLNPRVVGSSPTLGGSTFFHYILTFLVYINSYSSQHSVVIDLQLDYCVQFQCQSGYFR